jgi:hypothetical protein
MFAVRFFPRARQSIFFIFSLHHKSTARKNGPLSRVRTKHTTNKYLCHAFSLAHGKVFFSFLPCITNPPLEKMGLCRASGQNARQTNTFAVRFLPRTRQSIFSIFS